MAKTNLKPVSVYVTENEDAQLKRAAMLDNRSVSNYLLTAGLERAKKLGLEALATPQRESEIEYGGRMAAPAGQRISADQMEHIDG